MLGFSALSETTVAGGDPIQNATAPTGSVSATGSAQFVLQVADTGFAMGLAFSSMSGTVTTSAVNTLTFDAKANTTLDATAVVATTSVGVVEANINENLVSAPAATGAVGVVTFDAKANITTTSVSASMSAGTAGFDAKGNNTITGVVTTSAINAIAEATGGASIEITSAEAIGIAERDTTADGFIFDYTPYADNYSRLRTLIVTSGVTSTDNTVYINR